MGRVSVALCAIGIGIFALLFALLFDAAPDGTYNIGLLQKQMMIFQFGSLCVLVGTILHSAAHIASARPRSSLPAQGE
jgi:hypothetical protein